LLLLFSRYLFLCNLKNLGFTPLHLAAQNGFDQVLNLLLVNGADVTAKASSALITPLHLASLQGHTECVRILTGQVCFADFLIIFVCFCVCLVGEYVFTANTNSALILTFGFFAKTNGVLCVFVSLFVVVGHVFTLIFKIIQKNTKSLES
jgi:ankyrin repeat protein